MIDICLWERALSSLVCLHGVSFLNSHFFGVMVSKGLLVNDFVRPCWSSSWALL